MGDTRRICDFARIHKTNGSGFEGSPSVFKIDKNEDYRFIEKIYIEIQVVITDRDFKSDDTLVKSQAIDLELVSSIKMTYKNDIIAEFGEESLIALGAVYKLTNSTVRFTTAGTQRITIELPIIAFRHNGMLFNQNNLMGDILIEVVYNPTKFIYENGSYVYKKGDCQFTFMDDYLLLNLRSMRKNWTGNSSLIHGWIETKHEIRHTYKQTEVTHKLPFYIPQGTIMVGFLIYCKNFIIQSMDLMINGVYYYEVKGRNAEIVTLDDSDNEMLLKNKKPTLKQLSLMSFGDEYDHNGPGVSSNENDKFIIELTTLSLQSNLTSWINVEDGEAIILLLHLIRPALN
jgi:hypothetical protein